MKRGNFYIRSKLQIDIIDKSCGEVSLLEQDTIKNVLKPMKYRNKKCFLFFFSIFLRFLKKHCSVRTKFFSKMKSQKHFFRNIFNCVLLQQRHLTAGLIYNDFDGKMSSLKYHQSKYLYCFNGTVLHFIWCCNKPCCGQSQITSLSIITQRELNSN